MAQQPIYQQIAEDLKRKIDSGELGRGAQLPTELELRDQYDASRNTIRDAIKRLAAQGLVETRPGQGTFVTHTIDPFVTVLTSDPALGGGEGANYMSEVSRDHRLPRDTTPQVEIMSPQAEVAKRLGVEPDSQVVARHERRYIDDVPWSLQTSFYPMDFVTRGASRLLMAENIAQGAVLYLAEALGIRQTAYRDWITARLPDEPEQSFFAIGHEAMVFEIFRIAFDQHKAPMRLTVSVYPVDRNQFVFNAGHKLPDLDPVGEPPGS